MTKKTPPIEKQTTELELYQQEIEEISKVLHDLKQENPKLFLEKRKRYMWLVERRDELKEKL